MLRKLRLRQKNSFLMKKMFIGIITGKANNTWLFLQRNLVKTDRKTKLKCYTRPVLEYASAGWNPTDQFTLISKLEVVQQKSVGWICWNWEPNWDTVWVQELLRPNIWLHNWRCFMTSSTTQNRFAKASFLFAIVTLKLNFKHCLVSLNHVLCLSSHEK